MDKIKKIITNQYFILVIITLLALFIRLLSIDKPYGLWYDETLTYFFSSQSFPMGVLKALSREDFHMPLYYFYVGGWMKLFGTSDIALRLSSAFWGVLTVPAFFYMGKTYRSKALGYVLAVIACFSPILIYYSQEVRFYSMLAFFSTLSITLLLKLLDNPDKKNFILFGLTNLVILYTNTIGIIFVLLEILVLLVNFYFYKKEYLKKFTNFSALFFVLAIPYLILLLSYINATHQSFVNPFCWGKSGPMTIVFLINDWFSPLLKGLFCQDPDLYKGFFQSSSMMAMALPSLFFIVGFLYSFKNTNKKYFYLLSIAALFLAYEFYLYLIQDFVLMTKYTLIILPILLLISVDGLLSIKSKYVRTLFLSIILIAFIYNSIAYKKTSSFDLKIGGFLNPAKTITKIGDNKNNYLIYQDGSELFKKYLNNINFVDFNVPKILYLDKTKTEQKHFFNKDLIDTVNQNNSYEKLMPYFRNPNPSKETLNYFDSIINKIPKGGKLIILASIPDPKWNKPIDEKINNYLLGKTTLRNYKRQQGGLIYQKLNADMMNILNNSPSIHKTQEFASKTQYKWRFIVYQKL